MPYGKTRLVSVQPTVSLTTVKYGFRTNVDAATSTALGHAAVTVTDNAYPVGFCLGANSPKPARASKKFATGLKTSYCDATKRAEATTAGWKVGPASVRRAAETRFTQTVFVTFEGNKYGWRLPKAVIAKVTVAEFANLGIEVATGTEKDIIYGASIPRLPVATKENADGTTHRLRFDPDFVDEAIAADWSVSTRAEDTL